MIILNSSLRDFYLRLDYYKFIVPLNKFIHINTLSKKIIQNESRALK